MDEQPLAEQLAQVERDESDALDPRLERLAAGTLSPEEHDALTAEAESDPELAAQIALYNPLSEGALRGLSDVVQGELSAAAPPSAPRRGWLRVVPPLVLAAAAALLAIQLGGPGELPGYTVAIEAGDARVRGAPAAAPSPEVRRLRADSTLTLTLTPTSKVDGPVEARLFLQTEEGARVAPGRPEIDEGGAVRLRGEVRAVLGVDSGTVSVSLVVARPGALPAPDAAFEAEAKLVRARARLIVAPLPPL